MFMDVYQVNAINHFECNKLLINVPNTFHKQTLHFVRPLKQMNLFEPPLSIQGLSAGETRPHLQIGHFDGSC